MANHPKRNATTFQKGQAHPRPKGVRNKITRDIKEGLIDSAIRHGSNGKGAGGLGGYFDFLLKEDLRSHAALMGKLLPYNIKGDIAVGIVGAVNIVSIPVDRYLSKDDIARISPSSLSPMMRVIDAEAVEVKEKTVNKEETA